MLKKCLICLTISAFSFPLVSSLAFARGSQGVEELLQQGYEVKAAYQSPGAFIIHYLVLQKGASVFQCSSYNNGDTPYSNSFLCDPVVNIKK